MLVPVLLPGVLRGAADGQAKVEVEVEVGGPATLEGVLDALGERYPALERRLRDERRALRRYVNFYVGEEECRHLGGVAAEIPEGVQVQIIPSVAGG